MAGAFFVVSSHKTMKLNEKFPNNYQHFQIFSLYLQCQIIRQLIAVPSSTRIDAQYEIGLFLCPSVNHIVGIHELVPFTKFVDFAICDKCIRLSFPHFFALRNRTVV